MDPRAEIAGRVVEVTLGGRTLELVGHTDRVLSVEVSRDERWIVTASEDRDARVWDGRTGEPHRILAGHAGRVFDASFSPDGRWVVTGGPSTAGLWRTDTGDRFYFLRGRSKLKVTAAAFDGQTRIVAATPSGTRAYRCDICDTLPGLMALAEKRLQATGRELTSGERVRFGL